VTQSVRDKESAQRQSLQLGNMSRMGNGGIHVMNQKVQRETGRKAQLSNIAAGKAVSDIIRSTLGPRSMLKMILDPMGGIVMTNDGNSILREVDVSHPAAKSMIELSRAQEEEVGDGTTSVIVLAGEYLAKSEALLERHIHPTIICNGYLKALDDAVKWLDELAVPLDLNDKKKMAQLVESCTGTKFVSKLSDLLVGLALDAVSCVAMDDAGRKEIDIKRYAKTEKIPGGDMEDCRVLKGVMINKDVVHSKMRRRIENPRILLLDCTLEYKKGESQTQIELSDEKAWEVLLEEEENAIKEVCADIIAMKPDLVITEKGVSDLAQHYLQKANISVLRRVRKTDNNRIARACGATIVHRTGEIQEKDIGTKCGLFSVEKIGDEYYTWLVDCKEPKACTIVLRGASKDVLNEIERNLGDAMNIVRTIMMDPRLVPGGGAIEMTLANKLIEGSKLQEPIIAGAYKAAGEALEIISRTLLENCAADIIRVQTQLRAKHAGGANVTWGIDGEKGTMADMNELGVWEPVAVKQQTIKTAIESASMLLRIDEIVAGTSKPVVKKQSAEPQQQDEGGE
jgi:T-complex protein 1 subunit gamma